MNNNLVFKQSELDDNRAVFKAYINGILVGEVQFAKTEKDTLIIERTEVNDMFRGKNIGGQLIEKVVQLAIADKKKVVPLCSFAKKIFNKNPEYQKLLI